MPRSRKIDPEKERHWREILHRFQRSELSFRRFCADENISPNTFQYWRRELRIRDERAGKVPEITKGENREAKLSGKIKYWKQVLKDLRAYKGSANSFCRVRGISSGSLHYWTTKLSETIQDDSHAPIEQSNPRSDFVPVRVRDETTSATSHDDAEHVSLTPGEQIQVTLNDGMLISVPARIPVDTLLSLINGLRSGLPYR